MNVQLKQMRVKCNSQLIDRLNIQEYSLIICMQHNKTIINSNVLFQGIKFSSQCYQVWFNSINSVHLNLNDLLCTCVIMDPLISLVANVKKTATVKKKEHWSSWSACSDVHGNFSCSFTIMCAHFKKLQIKVIFPFNKQYGFHILMTVGDGSVFSFCAICKFSGAECSL